MTGFKLLRQYLRRRKRDFMLAAGVVIILASVFFLYDIPLEPLVYALILCAVLAIIFLGIDFGRFAARCRMLAQLTKQATFTLDTLPPAEDLVEQRYQELLTQITAKSAQAAAEARQAQQEMDEYYTLWAHQVKTPIAAARLLLQTGAGGEQTSDLELELFKIERYVEMALQYVRVESPSSDLVIRRCSLDGIVRQAIRRYARLFIEKRIALDYEGVDLEVLTDSKWLSFVIEQILANALKYTEKGRIAIYLDESTPHTLVIEDTGIGISAEDLPRVFEKGYTGYTGRREKHSTGIGLYLCKRILTRLNHTIVVESEVGRGTRVKIGIQPYNTVRLNGEM